jgi:riboflavin kinase/FMN adenylyltransferase
MEVVRQQAIFPSLLRRSSALIGNFDGMHRGHQQIIAEVRNRAEHLRRSVLLITFEPHPFQVLRPDAPPFRLLTASQKSKMAERLGVDGLVELPFDQQLCVMPARQFVADILVQRFGIADITVGRDFQFGHQRSGDVMLLEEMAAAGQYQVLPLEKLQAADLPISSSRIRMMLTAGEVREAAKLLGRPWSVQSQVIHGASRGRGLGYPTLNLALGEYLRPRLGVYAVWVRVAGVAVPLPGVANIGVRPTFAEDGNTNQLEPLCEVHVLAPTSKTASLEQPGSSASGPLFDHFYGQMVEVYLIDFLRDERRFDDATALQQQIQQDCIKADAVLGLNPLPL